MIQLTRNKCICLTYFYVDFSYNQQTLMYIGFLVGFSVKIPTNPFHVWLPHAHVEASTLGSVLLAGYYY